MRKFALRALVALSLAGAAAAPAMAIVDDGSGCGCIRPCNPVERLLDDQVLINDPSADDVQTFSGMLFSCWHSNGVELAPAGCYLI